MKKDRLDSIEKTLAHHNTWIAELTHESSNRKKRNQSIVLHLKAIGLTILVVLSLLNWMPLSHALIIMIFPWMAYLIFFFTDCIVEGRFL